MTGREEDEGERWWWKEEGTRITADAISALSASESPGTPPRAASASRTLGGNYPATAATLMGVYEERAPPTTGMHWVSVIPLSALPIGRRAPTGTPRRGGSTRLRIAKQR